MVKRTMYYVLTYDIASPRRLPKALKICRKYLFWVQNSVFEGELTQTQFDKLKSELAAVINKKEDSVIYYFTRTKDLLTKNHIGNEKSPVSFTF